MTRVDFYILDTSGHKARARLACRLADKAYSLGHRVHIHLDTQAEAATVDDMLWTFRDQSFVPHTLANDASIEEYGAPQVIIGFGQHPHEDCSVLINLAREVPDFFSRVDRVAEIVDSEPGIKTAGRDRFKFYRDRGYALESHKV